MNGGKTSDHVTTVGPVTELVAVVFTGADTAQYRKLPYTELSRCDTLGFAKKGPAQSPVLSGMRPPSSERHLRTVHMKLPYYGRSL